MTLVCSSSNCRTVIFFRSVAARRGALPAALSCSCAAARALLLGQHIKANRRNHVILGDLGNLKDFLFSMSWQSLELVGAGLRKFDGKRCFYRCECEALGAAADVDHYVPFWLYSRDLAHNFVQAHLKCNHGKSYTLAAHIHLERWLERITRQAADLAEIDLPAGIAAGPAMSQRVPAWEYGNAAASGGHAWLSSAKYEVIDQRYLGLFNTQATAT